MSGDLCHRALQEKKRLRQAELEAMGQSSTSVNMGEFSYESSAFIVHHTSILRNKRLLLVYTCACSPAGQTMKIA